MPFKKNYQNHILFMILASLSATACVQSFPNSEFSLLSMISLVPMFFIIYWAKNLKTVFFYGMWMGTITIAWGFSWLHYTINIYGGLGEWGAVPFYIIFSIAFSLKFAVTFLMTAYINKRLRISRILLFPICFVAIELLFPEIFPWYWGTFLYKNIFISQMAEYIGVLGLTFLLVMVNVIIFEIIITIAYKKKLGKLPLIIGISIIIIAHIIGIYRYYNIEEYQENANQINIALMQPNTPLGKSKQGKFYDIHRTCFRLSEEVLQNAEAVNKKIHLLIWPESAASFSFQNYSEYRDEPYVKGLKNLANKYQVYIYFSDLFLAKKDEEDISEIGRDIYYNNSTLIDPTGMVVDRYKKVYLLPFGEYLPGFLNYARKIDFMKTWVRHIGNFTAGDKEENIKLMKTNKVKFIPQICYEIIIPYFTRSFISENETADFIVNITNDKWFGKSKASEQHSILAMFRAIENRMPIVRSTNSGISLFIDAKGEVVAGPTLQEDKDILYHSIKRIEVNTLYSLVGDLFAYLCLLFLIIYIIIDIILRRIKKNT